MMCLYCSFLCFNHGRLQFIDDIKTKNNKIHSITVAECVIFYFFMLISSGSADPRPTLEAYAQTTSKSTPLHISIRNFTQ